MTWGWCLCLRLSKKVIHLYPFECRDSESWLCDWKNPHDRAEMHRAFMSAMWLKRLFLFIRHKTGWFDLMMTTIGSWEPTTRLISAISRCLKSRLLLEWYSMMLVLCWWIYDEGFIKLAIWLYLVSKWLINIDRYQSGGIITCTGLELGNKMAYHLSYKLKAADHKIFLHICRVGPWRRPWLGLVAQANALFLRSDVFIS